MKFGTARVVDRNREAVECSVKGSNRQKSVKSHKSNTSMLCEQRELGEFLDKIEDPAESIAGN